MRSAICGEGESGIGMAKKVAREPGSSRSGPRAPKGKKPLLVVIDEKIIKQAKIAAIEADTNVSQVTDALLRGWLAGKFKLDQ